MRVIVNGVDKSVGLVDSGVGSLFRRTRLLTSGLDGSGPRAVSRVVLFTGSIRTLTDVRGVHPALG